MNPQERQGDLVLAQGTYALVQDGATGQIDVIVGPNKISLADTDKPVIFDHNTGRFVKINVAPDAIQTNPAANEGQYIILTNPTKDDNGRKHPGKGKQSAVDLNYGHKINIPGPYNMALFPGQVAQVLDGHNLKSNEYLIVRVYNEVLAKQNLKHAVIKESENVQEKKKSLINESDLVIGRLFVIKGTDVSYYIPPTGIEVVKDSNEQYVRKAVTLERLEYCILLDQNGDKRFMQGPDVIFPNPTENFVMDDNSPKFRAIELNENMGIYIKVIADYEDHKSGDELFITGKEQKIYFPRPEHAVIKYGDQMIHYATAVPSGEARYVLDKRIGEVKTINGPTMLLPDPRTEVIVRRVLDEKTVQLWFPGNAEAIQYNQTLSESETGEVIGLMETMFRNDVSSNLKSTKRFSSGVGDMSRSSKYSKPRTITLDTKYEGAVRINVWPGYAIQVVKKTGERELIIGPKVKLLEYDEELEILSLSTGKPKSDQQLMNTVYLQTENNIVSDIIDAETNDSVSVKIRVSYRVNFDTAASKKWYNVSNYVKLLTQHLRSVVRNKVKKLSIEDFNLNATDIIRDLILGDTQDGKRPGKKFDENGMVVYDVEVLRVEIGDEEIDRMLKDAQLTTIESRIKLQQITQGTTVLKSQETAEQIKFEEKIKTEKKKDEYYMTVISSSNKQKAEELAQELKAAEMADKIQELKTERTKINNEALASHHNSMSEIDNIAHKERMAAITPGLIEAMNGMTNASFMDTLARNLKSQTGNFGLFQKGGFEGLLETIKGSPLEAKIKSLIKSADKSSDTAD